MSASAASMKPLTHYSPGGGCACKMPQAALSDMITALWTSGTLPATDGRLLVGLDTADDAAVYEVGNGRCLLLTCDFLTPVVDDPFNWGRIAAANALSDVYAMGGRPLLALNLLGWPADLNEGVLTEVLRGGARAIADAGALLAGGHSIVDPAPKYGLARMGEAARPLHGVGADVVGGEGELERAELAAPAAEELGGAVDGLGRLERVDP